VYADWLDEHGHPGRAEYLRLAVGWEREVDRSPNPYGWEYLPRLRELLQHPALRPPPPWSANSYGYPLPWLPTEVKFNSWSDFENHAAARFVLAHSCWRVRFDSRRKRRWEPKYVRRLMAAPELARVLDLDLSGIRVERDGARAIAESPHAASFARLGLRGCRINDEGVVALAGSPHLTGLVHLDLFSNPLTRAGRRLLRDRFGAAVRVAQD
jgi:hypothetical protein